MIPRYDREPQKAYVERALRAHGSIATYDALYNLTYHDGRKCSITRLAAIIWQLRDERWQIDTSTGHGATAVYRLSYAPPLSGPVITKASLRESEPTVEAVALGFDSAAIAAPAWVGQWRCSDCGGSPASEPVPMLGDLGRAMCAVCQTARYFRRAA